MRRATFLLLLLPACLAAQSLTFDEGRLDPAWFGPSAVLQPSKTLGFQWLKPGLALQGRSLQLRAWESPAWLVGRRSAKDRNFLESIQADLPSRQEKGLRRGLKEALPVATRGGDLSMVARVVDAEGVGDDYMAMGSFSLSFDMKLLDAATGELLGAFHGSLRGPSPEVVIHQFEKWCENLGRLLAAAAIPPVPAPPIQPGTVSAPAPGQPVATGAVPARPAPPVPGTIQPRPAFDLEGALRRIEGLKQDGLLSEEEYQNLRRKAAERAK
ncbi:MAG: hypothetical protein IPP58_04075 [Holophagaceae bacterium]|uniref:SHOCT domain-containing protein n=1 Tax=Candidatus Geothrix skivensis TaxID=2954439 RepID=A0A9D7XHG7_9BACT|nr:hypothetical protein [Candidatus Geothrix skivensis]